MNAIIQFLADHGYAWMKRMAYLAIMLALWTIFVTPYIDNLQIVMIWFLNLTLFAILPEQAIVFILQVFIYAVTFKILLWFFSSPQKDPHEIGHSPSFTSRRV